MIDIQVTEAGFESDKGVVPLMHFSMVAHVTLIDTRTGKTLQEQDYPYASKPQPYEFWFSDNHASLFREIAQANQVLASNIIENVFTR